MSMTGTKLDFTAFEPDKPILGGNVIQEARNVVPSIKGYRYFPQMADMGYDALSHACIEAFSTKDLSGQIHTLATDSAGIYLLQSGEWTSKYTGTPLNNNRAFQRYGDSIYALFGKDLLKSTMTGGTFSAFEAVEDAPQGKCLGIFKDFLVVGGSDTQGNKIHWSAIDNPDDWPTVGTDEAQNKMSDVQVFPVGGNVQALVGGVNGVDGIVFCEEAIYRATFTGPPLIFQFDPIDKSRGTVAAGSVIPVENVCYYLSGDGFKVTDGASVKSIGVERIDYWFSKDCDVHRIDEIRGAVDPKNHICVWSYPSKTCPENKHDRLLIYNYSVDRWSYATIETECLFEDYMRGKSLEDLDEYGDIDHLPFSSLDSSALREGALLLSGFTPDHKLASFSGKATEALLDTQEVGGERIFIHGVRPLIDRADASACILYRDRQSDDPKIGAFSSQSRDGICYTHQSTRYVSARVKIPAGVAWKNAVGIDLMQEKEGGY